MLIIHLPVFLHSPEKLSLILMYAPLISLYTPSSVAALYQQRAALIPRRFLLKR